MMGVNSDAAEAELDAMGNWIAEANPTRALSLVMEFQRRCASPHPGRGKFANIDRIVTRPRQLNASCRHALKIEATASHAALANGAEPHHAPPHVTLGGIALSTLRCPHMLSPLALRGRAPPSNRLEGERWHSRARGVPGLGQQAARVPDAPADTELGRCRDRQVGGAADRERRRVDHAIRAQQGGSDPPQHGMHLRVAALSRVDRMASYLYFLGVAANVRRPPLSGGSREPALGK